MRLLHHGHDEVGEGVDVSEVQLHRRWPGRSALRLSLRFLGPRILQSHLHHALAGVLEKELANVLVKAVGAEQHLHDLCQHVAHEAVLRRAHVLQGRRRVAVGLHGLVPLRDELGSGLLAEGHLSRSVFFVLLCVAGCDAQAGGRAALQSCRLFIGQLQLLCKGLHDPLRLLQDLQLLRLKLLRLLRVHAPPTLRGLHELLAAAGEVNAVVSAMLQAAPLEQQVNKVQLRNVDHARGGSAPLDPAHHHPVEVTAVHQPVSQNARHNIELNHASALHVVQQLEQSFRHQLAHVRGGRQSVHGAQDDFRHQVHDGDTVWRRLRLL
mmetsp:Transcript_131476/g.311733  ORF Transcript_131476/g.311733 Transcript_131476/m.311733 type:complete len:323 (+) Transcript_131476:1747-2715(+)